MSINSDQLRIAFKNPCRAATTGNVNVTAGSSPLTVDGVTLAAGDRVLVWQQGTPSENGIYRVITPGAANDGQQVLL